MSGPKELNANGTPGRAHATLAQLRQMWGKFRVVEGTEAEPRLIERLSMGDLQLWRHLRGRGSAAVFELVREGD